MDKLTLDAPSIAKRAGSEFEYQYSELKKCGPEAVAGYIEQTRALFAPIARSFDHTLNTEWFVRSYLSLKFVLAATLHANSARYAQAQNLQVVRPYLTYYSMLSCCRAFIFTLPCLPWRGAKSVEASHSSIIKTAADKLKRLDPAEATKCLQTLESAREQRNVTSYRFPASGLSLFGEDLISLEEMVRVARLFTELAQLNLACLEGATKKHLKQTCELIDIDEIWRTMRYETSTADLIDDDDYLRVGYFLRHYQGPVALIALATEGLVQDFFGAWYDEIEHGFNPDEGTDLLLDLW